MGLWVAIFNGLLTYKLHDMKNLLLSLVIVLLITGCSDNENNVPESGNKGNVEKAIEAISDKQTAKSIIVSGELTNDDWNTLKTINEVLPSIEKIVLSDTKTVKGGIFAYNDGIAWNTNQWLKSFEAPNATIVEDRAFMFCENLISVNLPLVEKIGKESFRVCDNLSSISLPKLKTSDDEAFVACDKLAKIDMPKLTNLADEIFSGCDLLEKVSFPCVTEIDSKVFYSCDNLKEITLGAPMPITTNIISFDGLNTEDITLYICGANWDEVTKRFHWRGIEWFDVVELK